MISNQILQNTIEGLKSIVRVDFCIMDTDGKEVASTIDGPSGCGPEAAEFAKSLADSQEIRGCQYFKIFDEQQLEYILVAEGIGEDVYTTGKVAAFKSRIYWWPIRSVLIKIILSKIFCWTTFF